MGDFQVHHVQFFEYAPQAVQSMAYNASLQKLAVARCLQNDNIKEMCFALIEIWNTRDTWFQERVFPALVPIEALIWCGDRLFSGGMDEQLHEHNAETGQLKCAAASNHGVIWCLASDESQSRIAAGTEGGCVVLFEVSEDGIQYSKAFSNQGDRILSIAWHEKMHAIVTGGIDNIRIWNIKSGQAIRRICVDRSFQKVETYVSALAIINDFTIVSGDSKGCTCFWDGHTGTQIKSLKPHQGPLFALCVTADGQSVLSSGADPSLIQFELVGNNSGEKWIRTATKAQHSHDVRSLVYTGNHVVSAGVDGKLVVNTAADGKTLSTSLFIAPVPQRPLVHCAPQAKSILLQYPSRVELWSLGSTSQVPEEDGDILDLETVPVCRVSLSTRTGCFVHCSATSSNAEWIAYADQRSFRLFHISTEKDDAESPVVITRVSCSSKITGVDCLVFSEDNTRLFVASSDGLVHIISLDVTNSIVTKVLNVSRDCDRSVHCNSLSVSPSNSYLAVGDISHGVHIYQLAKQKYVCSVPVSKPIATAFHKTEPILLVSSADRMLVEYDIARREYTAWSREFSASIPVKWTNRSNVLRRLFYNATGDKIFTYDEEIFCIIDKNLPFPPKNTKLFKSDYSTTKIGKYEAIHVCQRFKYLMFVDLLPDNSLVIVERSPSSLLESLPPSLRRKKFSVG